MNLELVLERLLKMFLVLYFVWIHFKTSAIIPSGSLCITFLSSSMALAITLENTRDQIIFSRQI
jgi:hypothetical protein